MSWLDKLSSWILGDPALDGLQPPVPTYEEVHGEIQNVLVPTVISAGFQLNAVKPINKNFALSYRYVVDLCPACAWWCGKWFIRVDAACF